MGRLVRAVILGLWLSSFASLALASGLYYIQGDQGSEVLLIQTKLKERGYYKGVLDGVYSYRTKEAVKSFQRTYRLPADGVVDSETYRVLVGREMTNSFNHYQSQKVVNTAKKYLGTPYLWGGTTPKGFDCSGFTQYVFKQQGRQLPRMADQQFLTGKAVMKNNLQAGDLVFFTTYEKGASHEGIYVGEGKFIHASSSHGVMISRLEEAYWLPRYLGARRVL